jgi:hypothetical protein
MVNRLSKIIYTTISGRNRTIGHWVASFFQRLVSRCGMPCFERPHCPDETNVLCLQNPTMGIAKLILPPNSNLSSSYREASTTALCWPLFVENCSASHYSQEVRLILYDAVVVTQVRFLPGGGVFTNKIGPQFSLTKVLHPHRSVARFYQRSVQHNFWISTRGAPLLEFNDSDCGRVL